MHEVLSNKALHLHAADGYKKTWMRVALDGSEGHEIVKEARNFWIEQGMRDKVNSAVAEVRDEFAAGRLSWTRGNVQRLILPYPKRKEVDAIPASIDDDTRLEEGECPFEDAADGEDVGEGNEEDSASEEVPEEDGDAPMAFAAGGARGFGNANCSGRRRPQPRECHRRNNDQRGVCRACHALAAAHQRVRAR